MNQQSKPEEIDIIQFFAAIGNLFKSFFRSIGNLFKWLFYLIIDSLLYIKKYGLYLGGGLLIGLVVSFIGKNKNPDLYYGEALLRTNFNSQLNLQEKVDAVNNLIRNKDSVGLGKMLKIPSSFAATFAKFDLEPVVNDVFLVEDYEAYLMTKDTTVYKFIKYDDYKKNIKKNDNLNPYWKLKIKAFSPVVFKNLNSKIIDLFNRDSLIEKRKKLYLSYLATQKQSFQKSLQDIDTMRVVFDKARLMPGGGGGQSINLMFSNQNSSNGGFEEAYNLFNERKKALINLKKTIEEINKSDNAVVILNGFPEKGLQETSLLANRHLKFALIGFLLVLFVFLLRDFNAYLNKYQQLKSGKTQ